MKIIKGKTASGFSYTINPNKLNDFELLEILAILDDNPLLLPKLLTRFLGEEQKKSLYDHVRLEDGTVPIDAVEKEINEIFIGNKETKN